MLTPVLGARAPIHPSNWEPIQSANSGQPVHMLMLASIAVTVSATRFSLKNRGGVQPTTCSPAENRGDPVASLPMRVELLQGDA